MLAACGGGTSTPSATAPGGPSTEVTSTTSTTTTSTLPRTTLPKQRIANAVATCAQTLNQSNSQRYLLEAALFDEGNTVTLGTEGNDDSNGVDYLTVQCVTAELEMPAFVAEQIAGTRALDGMQRAEWDDFEAVWTYHPDNGLRLTIHDAT